MAIKILVAVMIAGLSLWAAFNTLGSATLVKFPCTSGCFDSPSNVPAGETKADTLKQLRPIGKGEQVLEKRLDQKELT
jgi:hypothetical protein